MAADKGVWGGEQQVNPSPGLDDVMAQEDRMDFKDLSLIFQLNYTHLSSVSFIYFSDIYFIFPYACFFYLSFV